MIELSNSKRTFLGTTPDGRKRWALDCSIGAIRFRENGGAWQDIDPSIEEADTGDFSVKFTKVPYFGRISNDSRRRIYPDRTDLNSWIEFQKPFPNMPAPTRQGRWFYWNFPNALMGIRFDNASIKFGFRLKNSNAPTSITIPFTTQGITRQGRGLYHDGKLIAELRKPFATDASENEDQESKIRECEISFGTGEVTISLDTTGLTFPIDIDPTLDLDVGANNCDAWENENDGEMWVTTAALRHKDSPGAFGNFGAHRWVSDGFPKAGDTIDVAYFKLYAYDASYDDMNVDWHFEKAASPAVFTTDDFDISNRALTTAKVLWSDTAMGVDWHQSPSMVTPLQEVIDAPHSPTAIVVTCRSHGDGILQTRSRAYDNDPTKAAKLHIEWTVAFKPRVLGII